MKIVSFAMLLVLVAALGISYRPKPAFGAMEARAAVDAILRDHCKREYWDYPRPSASTLPVAVRIDGDTAYAWVEGLDVLPRVPRVARFFAVVTKNGHATVSYSNRY